MNALQHLDWHDGRMWLRLGMGVLITVFYAGFVLSSTASFKRSFARKWGLSAGDAKWLWSARYTPLTRTLNALAVAMMFAAALPILVEAVLPYRGGTWLGAMAALFGLPAAYLLFGLSAWATPARVVTRLIRMSRLKPADLPASRTVADIEVALSKPVASVWGTRIAGTIFIGLACASYGCIVGFHLIDWVNWVIDHCPKC